MARRLQASRLAAAAVVKNKPAPASMDKKCRDCGIFYFREK